MRWLLLAFGVIGVAAGIQEWYRRAAAPPQFSCAELAEKGADGKIELTRFLFRTDAARGGWVPVVPFAEGHDRAAVRVIVALHEQSDLVQTAEQDTLRGVAGKATEEMKKAYPGVEWVVREDRKLAGRGTIAMYLGVGLIALVMFSRSLRSQRQSKSSAP